jgi:hypothetical protein
MTSGETPQTISATTDGHLRTLANEYASSHIIPHYVDAAVFPTVYEDEPYASESKTLFTTVEGTSLTIAAHTPAGDTALFVIVDLGPDSPAAVVHPQFVQPRKGGNSVFTRTFVRLLTETEGLALASDLKFLLREQNQ